MHPATLFVQNARDRMDHLADVTAASRGDRHAFARLVDSHASTICSISLAIVRDVAASEDVAQEVFLTAWQKLGRLRNPASFLPWLRQLARNAARGWLRGRVRQQRRVAHGDAGKLERATAQAADPAADAQTALEIEEERRVLAQAIESLPDDAREVVVLFYREGQSIAQVAQLLGLSEDAIKQRLARARGRLRQELWGKLEQLLVRTAPGAAFTATIVAGIAVAPSSAAAATAVAVGAAKSVGAASALSAASGAALGLLGVLGNFRGHWRRAGDAEEKRGLVRAASMNVAVVLAMALAVLIASSRWVLTVADAALGFFIAFSSWTELVWLPRRVTGRRLEAECAADPAATPDRLRRQRTYALVALGVGEAIIIATLIAHLP
jgi:RNA polymerase sigma factor (sigma-70 family)